MHRLSGHAQCIADLLLVAKVRRSQGRLGVIANRVRGNTLISQTLMRFLRSLDIPLVTTLRDSQNYVRAAQIGVGIHELPDWQVRRDLEDWAALEEWLGSRRPVVAPLAGGAEDPAPAQRSPVEATV